MLTEQEEFWRGDFGVSYTTRNRPDWRKRIPFWRSIIEQTKPKSILEIGSNAGWNLRAIREVNPMIAAWGCDINQTAIDEASDAGLSVVNVSVFDLAEPFPKGPGIGNFDLTFTAGVLIHVAPADLERAMRIIIETSNRYVLAVEYADDQEVAVRYRGHSKRLWRRPFGSMYERMGLKLIKTVKVGKEHGFDDCTAWLMERA